MTKSIYVFEESVFNLLWETECEKLNLEALKRLPEWCVYIQAPDNFYYEDSLIKGWFYALDDAFPLDLRICLDTDKGLIDCILELRSNDMTLYSNLKLENADESHEELMKKITSVTLYLCSEEVDIIGDGKKFPKKPKIKKTRKLKNIEQGFNTWEVGYTISKYIKDSQNYVNDYVAKGGKKRPHYRKAHWHSYWTGRKNSDDRKIIVKWIPPTFINMEDIEDNIIKYKKTT